MVEQGVKECNVFHEAAWICLEETTEHTRKVLYLEKCYRAVCAGERLSQKIQLDLSKAFLVTGICSSMSALEHAGHAVALNKCEQKQKCSNNKMVKMHIQLCKNIVLGNYYCALLWAGT